MEHTASIALALIIPTWNAESRSALPDAPTVDDGRNRPSRGAATRAWLATALHRAAWWVEPEPWTTAHARRAPSCADAACC